MASKDSFQPNTFCDSVQALFLFLVTTLISGFFLWLSDTSTVFYSYINLPLLQINIVN